MRKTLEKITLLNIPNYYSSFYLLGLSKCAKLSFRPSEEFKKWNGFPIIIFQKENELIIIDNADPVCVREELYQKAAVYFTTNKLLHKTEYNQLKIQPLFPHYPINCWRTYLKIFKGELTVQMGTKRTLKEMFILQRRPLYNNHRISKVKQPYIFFAGSIWKNEPEANMGRSEFIKACKRIENIEFEGGLMGRSDGNNFQFHDVLSQKKYSPKQFSKKSAQSLVGFNNPAVLGAVSWRFADYLNRGSAVISLPWQIEMPEYPLHGKEIHMIENIEEVEGSLRFLIKNNDYRNRMAKGGKEFFIRNCDPVIQARRILNMRPLN